MNNQPSQTPKLVGSVVITAIVMIGVYVLILTNKPTNLSSNTPTNTAETIQPVTDSNSTQTTPVANQPAASSTTTASYKDGTYSASASYRVPGEENSIKVTISLKNDIVTTVSTQDSYGDYASEQYINNFKQGISGAVVGKKLNNAHVSRLNGASDTSEGFNEAINAIIQQAQA